jgi:rhamnogalacturonan endolyase
MTDGRWVWLLAIPLLLLGCPSPDDDDDGADDDGADDDGADDGGGDDDATDDDSGDDDTVQDWPPYPQNPFVIPISGQPFLGNRGGLLIADLNGDGLLDYLITTKDEPLEDDGTPGSIGAYDHDGDVLWIVTPGDLRINGNAENYGLPGWSGPGIAAGDVDDDGEVEILHIDTSDHIVVRRASDGSIEDTIDVEPPPGERWGGLIQIVDLTGGGDHDVIIQSEMGPDSQNPFDNLTAVDMLTGTPRWSTDAYWGQKHGGFRAVDIDGDGMDEVPGGVFIDDDGTQMNPWMYADPGGSGHFDSVFVYDVRPEIPGLETVLLEESFPTQSVSVVTPDEVVWRLDHNAWEPQNAAVGDFDPSLDGLEIWCRSRVQPQTPWVLDAHGNVIYEYNFEDHKPTEWVGGEADSGVEFINVIDWQGGDQRHAMGKARHTEGMVGIFDPMTGDFLVYWTEMAARVQAADVAGDFREEVVVVNAAMQEIRVYWKEEDALGPDQPRYWTHNWYRRQKQNYNYYSP